MAKLSTVELDRVRKIALALPDVEEATSYGVPAFKVQGKMFVCEPTHRTAEPGSLVVRVSLEDRAELIEAEPETYYVTDHYAGYTSVLVRLARIRPDALRDLVAMAYQFMKRSTTRPLPRKRR